MQTKWFQPASWRSQDAPPGAPTAAPPLNDSTPAAIAQLKKATSMGYSSGGSAVPGGELLGFDEIYRSAGIHGQRLGYSISKVIEMLQSEHIRSMAPETKRASLLMALEAAGVQLDEILQDASARQRALSSYEAIQRKHLEEYEALKAQDNCAIQAELDRVTEQYHARINANLDEVAHEKDRFRKWQAKKEQHAQRIAEAVALCVTQAGPQAPAEQPFAFREVNSIMSNRQGRDSEISSKASPVSEGRGTTSKH